MTGQWTRGAILRQLERLKHGALTVAADGRTWTFGNPASDPRATIAVTSPRMWTRVALGGSLGAAESYLRGEWMADDLTAVLRIFARNLGVADRLEGGPSRIARLLASLGHRVRRNSRRGSRRNIHDHYDLGNDLFALFLDDTLTYSSGIFERDDMTMREASVAKLDRVCRKLALTSQQHVIEIGTGWGSFALHAATHYGCRVTTTTISDAQYEVAARRIAAAGLCDRVTLLRTDYRDLTGTFDALVSIEMIEAVGHEHFDTFFATCSRLLKPDGVAVLQGIVMPDYRYRSYLGAADFIQRYVFHGSALPSIGAMTASLGRATDLRLTHLEDLAPHYATTLRRWREQFMSRADEVRRLGYDERFIRLWEYYLAYCEAGFAERCTGVVQVILEKPGCRRVAGGAWASAQNAQVGDASLLVA